MHSLSSTEGGSALSAPSRKPRLVVIGNGMVSHRLCATLTERSAGFAITVLGDEPRPAYDRVHLTSYFEKSSPTELELASREWYAQQGITLHTGVRATRIDRQRRVVEGSDGVEYPYDTLVMATGSRPFVPPLPGASTESGLLPGVFLYRTIEDLDGLRSYARGRRTAAVMGGGLLGLEAGKALLDLGLETTVLEVAPRLMPRQLDAVGGRVLARHIESLGVAVRTGVRTVRAVGAERLTALELEGGETLPLDLLVISCGIRPNDELAAAAGLTLGTRGGVAVDDALRTTDPAIFAIGECAAHRDMCWGLVAPGYAMADAVARTLTDDPSTFEGTDGATKLKLLGVDVGTFGELFPTDPALKSVSYEDSAAGTYSKLWLSADGTRLLGGMLVGDAGAYGRLSGLCKSGKTLDSTGEALLFGPRGDSGAAPDDTAQLCSCNNVSRGDVACAIRDGRAQTVADLKKCTRAGTGCAGCVPELTEVLHVELAKLGKASKKRVCEHFDHSRQDLYLLVKAGGLRTFEQLLAKHGSGSGCEICKPTVASILASIHNEPILDHVALQDTNDRFLANIQRQGLYSVVPRVPGGEITPDGLIAIANVAKKYGLYTKITGGQRIDLFGAQLAQLPSIWEELVDAGFETGHAYGKALRTVKSCVGSTWCRFGVQDSVSMAIRLEHRYKGLRAPHKLKSAVSGCVRECAEAQSKDFSLIATEQGYNVYVGGNGGAKPRHADLLVSDVDEETAIRYLDRFLVLYIRSADRLTRTSKWVESLEGGVAYLREVIVDDRLGIGAELEAEMAQLIAGYRCEWTDVVRNPERRALFNELSDGTQAPAPAMVETRGQRHPAHWPESSAEEAAPKSLRRLPVVTTRWVDVGSAGDFLPELGQAVRYGATQIAVFNFASRGEWYAIHNQCPHKRDLVLARGLTGDDAGRPKVACPQHKKTFDLRTGEGLSDPHYSVAAFPVRVEAGRVMVELPEAAVLEGSACSAAVAAE